MLLFHMKDVFFERSLPNKNTFEMTIGDLSIGSEMNGANSRVPIMGVTGHGKSTLLGLMAGLIWPKSGVIRWSFFGGMAVEWGEAGPVADQRIFLSKRFGFAFQASTLLPHLTVEENLVYPLRIHGWGRKSAIEKARHRLAEYLVEPETPSIMGKMYPHQLSGGQRQRIGLVQSLIHDPEVLFADEPTGSLDAETRRAVMRVLVDWVNNREKIRLLIWVTHHEDDPMFCAAKRLLRVENGQVFWEELEGNEREEKC